MRRSRYRVEYVAAFTLILALLIPSSLDQTQPRPPGATGNVQLLNTQQISKATEPDSIEIQTPRPSWIFAKPDELQHIRISKNYGKLPLSFEANEGQTDSQVKFLSRGRGYTLFLTATEAVLVLSKPAEKPSAVSGQPATKLGRKGKGISKLETPDSKLETVVVRMKLVGANPDAEIRGLEELPGKSNYFIGNDPEKWRTNVANFKKVEYREVYPGINLVFYGNQRQLEYDFVVSPGADPSVIKLTFEGAEKIETDEQGDLVLATAGGELRMRKPLVYQEVDGRKHEISGNYVLNPQSENPNPKSEIQNLKWQTVGFQLAAYDADKPIIIDPVLSYSTYLGGSDEEEGFAITVDLSGNAYVTGRTFSVDFPTTAGAFQTTFNTAGPAFVTKLNATGSALVYSTYLGGSDGEEGHGIALDASGNAYVTGFTNSPDFPTTAGTFQTTFGGGISDAFVTKLNATGSALVYSTYLGGNDRDQSLGIAVDASGSAYVTGFTSSPDFPATVGTFQGAFGGGFRDGFVTKLNVGGSALVYSTYLGGSDLDVSFGIAIDSSGQTYVTGDTLSLDFPTTASAFQTASGGAADTFVTKLNATGSALVYSTYLGGSEADGESAIAVDASGSAYVTGFTSSPDFPVTVGAFQTIFGGFTHAFVTKLNAAGSVLVYSTYLGGSTHEEAFGIAVDSSGRAYVTGETESADFPVTPDAFQTTFGGGISDAFVTILNPAGSALAYSTYLGGTPDEEGGRALAVDSSGNAYVTGFTFAANFPTTAGVFQTTFGGSLDAFVAKISSAAILATDSATAAEGETVTASTAPTVAGQAGVTAMLTNNTVGSGPATVTVTTFSSNPETVSVVDVGGGFVDVNVSGADATDVVVANFYYPSTVTGATEASLELLYFNGSAWVPVLSSGGAAPLKDTTDNLDGTVSGGRFLVTFDNTSTPQITQLTGTVFTMTITIPPVFLHASGTTLFLDGNAPTGTTAKFKDSAGLKFAGGNAWKEIGTWSASPASSAQSLTALSDLRVWLGLKNSDDIGTRFDLRTEIYRNGTLVASGETFCITGLTRNAAQAKEIAASFGSISNGDFASGDALSLRVLTRIGTSGGAFCGGHSSAVGLRLYFDAVSRPAQFGASFTQGP